MPTCRLPVYHVPSTTYHKTPMAAGNYRRPAIRELTSRSNPLLKVFRRALERGVTREGWLAIEGPHLVEEALEPAAQALVHSLLLGRNAAREFRELLKRVPKEAEVVQVPDRLFEQVAQTQAPQGIAALVELRPPDLDSILARGNIFLLVACGVQDPANIGVMMRSAQALGATALVTLPETVSPFNPKAVRSSAGAVFRLPVFENIEPRTVFPRLRAARVRIIAADQHSPAPLWQADLKEPVAVMIGREGTGLAPDLFKEASQLLSIPIHPGTESINAATAASIFLYEAARQRGFRYGEQLTVARTVDSRQSQVKSRDC